MKEDVDRMAVKLNITAEEVLAKLKENYDGYHFTYPSPDIYNPFSLLNAFADGKFNSYWFGSGTPTYLIKMLDKFGVEPSEIGNKLAAVEEFDAPTETMSSITPLLYQSGYVTIKDYDKELELYTLDIPNKEVRVGLMRSLLPYYVTNDTREATTWWLLFPVISGKVIWTRHYGVCKPFCLLYLNAIIQSTKVITSRYSISYSACWDTMWMSKYVLPVVVWM